MTEINKFFEGLFGLWYNFIHKANNKPLETQKTGILNNEPVVNTAVMPEITEPFFTFACEDCGTMISIEENFYAGQACLVECSSCGESFTVFSPSLQIYRTNEFEPIWKPIQRDLPDWKK